MLSKEEIEKAKEKCKSIVKVNKVFLKNVENQTINQTEIKAIEILLQYIDQLEQENKTLKQCLIDNNTKDTNEHLYLGNTNM